MSSRSSLGVRSRRKSIPHECEFLICQHGAACDAELQPSARSVESVTVTDGKQNVEQMIHLGDERLTGCYRRREDRVVSAGTRTVRLTSCSHVTLRPPPGPVGVTP